MSNKELNAAQKIMTGVDFDSILEGASRRVTHDVPVLFDDDGEPKAGFRIVGKNSPEYQAEHAAIRAEGHKRAAKRKTAIDTSTDEGAMQLVNLVDDNQRRLALAVTVESYGFESGGAPLQLSKAQIAAAFDKFPTWQDRVAAALEQDANFLKV
jgi:lipoprotein-anchoring transpeptidase ErfK/SrfK